MVQVDGPAPAHLHGLCRGWDGRDGREERGSEHWRAERCAGEEWG